MNDSMKKIIVCLFNLVAYMALVVVSRLGLPDFTVIPVILCGLLCGLPWGPLMGVVVGFAGHMLFSGYLAIETLGYAGSMLLVSLIPSLLSNKAGTNLSSASKPSAGTAFLAAAAAAVVNHLTTALYAWLFIIRPYGGTLSMLPGMAVLIAFVVTIVVVPVLALKLGGNKSTASNKGRRHSDDDR